MRFLFTSRKPVASTSLQDEYLRLSATLSKNGIYDDALQAASNIILYRGHKDEALHQADFEQLVQALPTDAKQAPDWQALQALVSPSVETRTEVGYTPARIRLT